MISKLSNKINALKLMLKLKYCENLLCKIILKIEHLLIKKSKFDFIRVRKACMKIYKHM